MPAIDQTRILIIATDGFEQSELFDPRDQLIGARYREARLARKEAHSGHET